MYWPYGLATPDFKYWLCSYSSVQYIQCGLGSFLCTSWAQVCILEIFTHVNTNIYKKFKHTHRFIYVLLLIWYTDLKFLMILSVVLLEKKKSYDCFDRIIIYLLDVWTNILYFKHSCYLFKDYYLFYCVHTLWLWMEKNGNTLFIMSSY